MPILHPEPAWFPASLFDNTTATAPVGCRWRVLHTKPRQEKSLARQLLKAHIPFYLPLLPRRIPHRGRVMTSHVPLFPGYLFLLASSEERVQALATRRVARALEVPDQEDLSADLIRLWRLLASGAPVAPEDRLAPGMTVEITRGALAGLSGKIVRAASGRRFVVEVHFIQRGASVLLDDFALEPALAVSEAESTRV